MNETSDTPNTDALRAFEKQQLTQQQKGYNSKAQRERLKEQLDGLIVTDINALEIGELSDVIAKFINVRANEFDPAKFCYIDTMSRRASEMCPAVAIMLGQKALAALREYHAQFVRSRNDAKNAITVVKTSFPAESEKIQQLFEDHNYNGVQRLKARLERNKNRDTLVVLSRLIMAKQIGVTENEKGYSFDDVLLQQEHEVVSSLANTVKDSTMLPSNNFGDLKSVRLFKESWRKISADRLVTQALADAPEGAGPLNGQQLAVRSLSVLRDLSPAYLNRFVTYFDSMLWLEQSIEVVPPVPVKKAKAKRKRKKSVK